MTARQPRALYLLALVQMLERYAGFSTLPLLVLYLEEHHKLGSDSAMLLFGVLQVVSSLGGLPAGALSDRWLGPRLTTLLGALLLLLSYGTLALDRPLGLWPALALMAAGYGLFRPGLQTLAGGLYSPADPRREGGFMLLHVVLNIGTTVGPLVAEWARAGWGWPAVFLSAALAMLASTGLFVAGATRLRTAPPGSSDHPVRRLDATTERAQIRACWLLCAMAVVFWLSAMQSATSLSLFAAQNTEPHLSLWGFSFQVRPGHFLALHSLLVLLLLPPLLGGMAFLRRRGVEPSTPGKMVWGFVVSAASFAVMGVAGLCGGDTGRVGSAWLVGCYVLLTLGEMLLWPMGLALLTRLAPPQRTSQMIGLWFASTALGNGLTGALGLLWTRWPHHLYFALLILLTLGAAVGLLVRLRPLEQLLRASGDSEAQE